MMDITIFLASSSELNNERERFSKYISQLNEDWIERDICFKLKNWENSIDSISKDGLQAEYNKVAEMCDIFVMLFFTKVGKFTAEEFDVAFKKFEEKGKPRIYTYFKEDIIYTGDIGDEIISMIEFKRKLRDLKHYYTTYRNFEDLQWQFTRQLDKLCKTDFLTSENIVKFKPSIEIDSDTIEAVCKLLSPNTPESKIPGLKLDELIMKSSNFGKSAAFQLAKVNRRSNRINEKELMARSIPVFEALISIEESAYYHSYYGQLAFALKDKKSPNWAEAEKNFNTAIKVRRKAEKEPFYEFNRAICKIMGDSNFKSERPSEEQTRKMILKDVINSKLELSDQLDTILDEPDNKVLLQWFEINALDIGKV